MKVASPQLFAPRMHQTGPIDTLACGAISTIPSPTKAKREAPLSVNRPPKPVDKRTNGCACRCLSYLVAGVEICFTRLLMWCKKPPEAKIKSIDEDLNKLSGSSRLSESIHAGSAALARGLQSIMSSSRWHQGLNYWLDQERLTLTSLIDRLLPSICLNIGNLPEVGEKPSYGQKRIVSLPDIFAWFLKTVSSHLPGIKEAIKSNGGHIDPTMFRPLVKKLLDVMFPEGIKGLPISNFLWIAGCLWKKLENDWLPSLCADLYQKILLPFEEQQYNVERLKSVPEGESLIKLSQAIGKNGGRNLPKLFTDDDSVVAEAICEFFVSHLSGSDEEKDNISYWLYSCLKELSQSNDPGVREFLMLLGGYLEPLMLHVFASASKGVSGNVWTRIVIKLFSLFSVFFNRSNSAIESYITDITESNVSANPKINAKLPYKEIDRYPEILEVFEGLSDDLFEFVGITCPKDLPVPEFLQDIIFKQIRAFGPKFTLKQYLAIKETPTQKESLREKLKSLLFDPKNIEKTEMAIPIFRELYLKKISEEMMRRQLWKSSGTEDITKMIEVMCSTCAKDFVSLFLEHAGINKHPFLGNINNAFMEDTRAYLEELTETIFLQMLVNAIETTDKIPLATASSHPKYLLPLQLLLRFTDVLETGLRGLKRGEGIDASPTFVECASKLYSILGDQILNHLPLGQLPGSENIKQVLADAIKELLLPQPLESLYSQLSSWQQEKESSMETLDRLYHTTHPLWASRVVGQFSSDWIKNYLAHSSNEAARPVLNLLQTYFDKGDPPEGEKLSEALRDPSSDLGRNISANIQSFGASEAEDALKVWPALASYVEAIVAKFFAEITRSINEVETENPDFMKDLAITMLNDTEDYIKLLKNVRDKSADGVSIDAAAILASQDDRILFDSKISTEEKNRFRLKKYFIPLASKLFSLANISAEDFPFPPALREVVGGLVIDRVLPNILLQLYLKMLESPVRDAMMLNFVQTLYNALNDEKRAGRAPDVEEAKDARDAKQKILQQECTTLVAQFVDLISDPIVKYVFAKDKVQQLSAAIISDAMDKYLSKWTLVQLIDNAIFNGLSKFHPGSWKGKMGREDFIPLEDTLHPNGKVIRRPAKAFQFKFANTPEEVAAEKIAKTKSAEETHKFLRNECSILLSSQLMARLWIFIKATWNDMQAHCDDLIQARFPENGPKVKAVLDQIFGTLFFYLLGTVVQVFFPPILKAIQFVVDKLYIDHKSDGIIESIRSEALELLVHKWTGTLLDALLMNHQKRLVKTN